MGFLVLLAVLIDWAKLGMFMQTNCMGFRMFLKCLMY